MSAARFTVTKAKDEEEQQIIDDAGTYGSVPVKAQRSGKCS